MSLHRFAAFVPLALFQALLVACTSGGGGVAQEAVYQTPTGVAVVDTFTTVATVTAIDAATRKITMRTPDGKSGTYKASKNVDLGAFAVGEDIGVQISDETILSIKKGGAPPRDAVATSLAVLGDGGNSAVFEGEAVEVSATVIAVDPSTRKITLRFEDGKTRSLKAHTNVDLTQLNVGANVTVQYAVAVIVAVANA